MVQLVSHLSQSASGSGSTLHIKSAIGFDDNTVFGTGSANIHRFTGSLYVSQDVEIADSLTVETGFTSNGRSYVNDTLNPYNLSVGEEVSIPRVNFEVHYSGSKNPTNLGSKLMGGETVYFGTASFLNAGALHYLNSDGGWELTNANGTGSLGTASAGNQSLLAICAGDQATAPPMMIRGWVNMGFLQGTFTPGAPVYVYSGSTAYSGHVTTVAPTAANSYVRIVGYCTDTPNVIYFNPSSTWVEIS